MRRFAYNGIACPGETGEDKGEVTRDIRVAFANKTIAVDECRHHRLGRLGRLRRRRRRRGADAIAATEGTSDRGREEEGDENST